MSKESTSKATRVSLPYDILFIICRFLDTDTLRAFALTCAALCDVADARIWNRITISHPFKPFHSLQDIFYVVLRDPIRARHIKHLILRLSNQQSPPRPRELLFHFKYPPYKKSLPKYPGNVEPPPIFQIVVKLLHSMPNLKTLTLYEIPPPYGPLQESVYDGVSANVFSFRLVEFTTDVPLIRFDPFLRAQPRILRCRGPNLHEPGTPLPLNFLPKLQTLASTWQNAINLIPGSPISTLTLFTPIEDPAAFITALRAVTAQITNLRLHEAGFGSRPDRLIARLDALLPHLPHLVRLALAFPGVTISPEFCSALFNSLQLLTSLHTQMLQLSLPIARLVNNAEHADRAPTVAYIEESHVFR